MKRDPDSAGSPSTDLVYAGVAVVAATLALISADMQPAITGCVALALVPWALIVARRPLPLPAFAAMAVIPIIPVVAWTSIGSALFLTIAAASRLASRSDSRWLVATVTTVIMAIPFLPVLVGFEWDIGAIYFAFGGAFGVLVGVLLRHADRLASKLRDADAELADAAARQERHRIARDVHDLVAHSLTVVVLHIGGARRILTTDPPAAAAALADAERVCRESLDGIRGVVGLLRDGDEPHALSLDFEQLANTYRSAGLPITLHVSGAPDALPLAERVTLYRVVQEALANAARHTQGLSAIHIELLIDQETVVARITNDYPASNPARLASSGGYGLAGLREQVASLGGELTSGREADAWILECRLPPRPAGRPNTSTSTASTPGHAT
jgi:signal transduction histidine kinase